MQNDSDFIPIPIFSGCHAQTILGSLTNFSRVPPSYREYVMLPDLDCLTMEICAPPGWKASDPTVVLVHGLCGSDRSNYLLRIAKKFYKLGIRSVRLNLRGCGSSKGLARFIYHCGSSDDVLYALKFLKRQTPESKISLVGFSLGGNIVLKLAGELGEAAKDLLAQVIAVNPPANLKTSVQLIGQPKNHMYEKYFIRLLREDVHYRHELFSLPKIKLPQNMSIFEFDEYYIAPQIGFKSALDYYQACSAKTVIHQVAIPCQVLFAEDDPIVDTKCLDNELLPDNVSIVKTKRGGHLGFLSSPFTKSGVRWMDFSLIRWISQVNPKKL